MKWIVRGLAALIALIVVAALIVWLIPLDRYRPGIEAAAAKALRQPVHIGGLGASLLPLPQATLTDVVVGEKGELTIARISVRPELLSVLSGSLYVSKIEIERARSTPSFLAELVPEKSAEAGPAVRIGSVHVSEVELLSPGITLPKLDVEVSFAPSGSPAEVRVRDEARTLALLLKPQTKGPSPVSISAKQFKLPAGPPLILDELQALGTLSESGLELPDIRAKLYQGSVTGNARLGWKKNDASLSGRANVQGLALVPLLAVLTPKKSLSGRLDASARFSSTAREMAKLADALHADGSFVVHDGVLHGVDLASAARFIGAKSAENGETHFDRLSSNFQLQGRNVRLDGIQASSGSLAASGNVAIGADKQLAGRVAVDLKTGISIVTVPLRISGSLDKPSALPTGAAVAGAAAGTAVLGPGIGTSLGTKAADTLDKLFGRKR